MSQNWIELQNICQHSTIEYWPVLLWSVQPAKVRSFTDKLEWAVPDKNPFSTTWKPTHPCRISRTYNVLFLCFAERTNGRKRGLYEYIGTLTPYVFHLRSRNCSRSVECGHGVFYNMVFLYSSVISESSCKANFCDCTCLFPTFLVIMLAFTFIQRLHFKATMLSLKIMIQWPWIVYQSYTKQLYKADTPLNNAALHVWGWPVIGRIITLVYKHWTSGFRCRPKGALQSHTKSFSPKSCDVIFLEVMRCHFPRSYAKSFSSKSCEVIFLEVIQIHFPRSHAKSFSSNSCSSSAPTMRNDSLRHQLSRWLPERTLSLHA